MKKQATINTTTICKTRITALKDTMEVLSGKWKFHIIGTLLQSGPMRFMDLLREVGVAPKMLSKELHDLEVNQLVTRTVLDTKPVTVEYDVTAYGKNLEKVIDEIAAWGTEYRKAVYKDDKKSR